MVIRNFRLRLSPAARRDVVPREVHTREPRHSSEHLRKLCIAFTVTFRLNYTFLSGSPVLDVLFVEQAVNNHCNNDE